MRELPLPGGGEGDEVRAAQAVEAVWGPELPVKRDANSPRRPPAKALFRMIA